MFQVPGSLGELVSLFAGCFTQPTFRTFRALLLGFIARVGEHTITGCLVACGMAGGWHHSRGHRFFSRALVAGQAWACAAGSDRRAPGRSRCAAFDRHRRHAAQALGAACVGNGLASRADLQRASPAICVGQ